VPDTGICDKRKCTVPGFRGRN